MKTDLMRIALILLLSLVFTGLVVNYSETYGRLAFPPDYDDSHSLVEGALRWLTFRDHGLKAACNEYLQRLPHSFLHYYFASASFALFGIHAAVVYWTSSLFLLTALLALSALLGRGAPVRTFALLIVFLCVPAVFNLIFDFRSECALAALLFAACCAMIRAAWADRGGLGWSTTAGALFALALGFKPAMFPYTLGMAAGGTGLFVISALVRERVRWPVAARNIAWVWVVMILPFGFHYVLNWDWVAAYILNIAFKSDLYQQSGTRIDQLLYHFLGFPGQFQLGRLAWPLLGVVLSANLVAFLGPRSGDLQLRRYLRSSTYLTGVAYAGVAVNSMVQNYFGMTFDFLLAASGVLGIQYVANRLPRVMGQVLCLAAALAAMATWEVPPSQNYLDRTRELGGDASVEWRREGPPRTFQLIRPFWAAPAPITWVAAYGWTDGNTLAWEAARQGLHWKIWNYYEKQPAPGKLFPDDAEILVVPDPGLTGTIDLPCNKGLADLRGQLEADNRFQLIGAISDPSGRSLRVYHRGQ